LNDSLARWCTNPDKVHVYGLINYETYSFCLKTHNGSEMQDYLTAVQPPYFMGIVYPFDGYCPNCNSGNMPGLLPSNVSFYNSNRYTQEIIDYETAGINAMHESYDDYNTELQRELQVESDIFGYQDSLAKRNSLRFIAEPQVCQWKTDSLNEFQREPMN